MEVKNTEERIKSGLRATLNSIHTDLNAGSWSALYFAGENQILTLVNDRGLDETFIQRWHDYQEEMHCLLVNSLRESN